MARKQVTMIPAIKPKFSKKTVSPDKKRRVAAYARVSTDSDEQFTSFEAQVDYYTKYIQNNSGWTLVGIYTDEGISGTNIKHRDGFNRMIKDALAGKIDLIVTKSVSRFARNTVDSLTTIRKLKEAGCEVFFEKENIYSFDGKGELLLTIMSSLAQEESRSISENVTWGQRKRFSDGKVSMPYKHFLGYERGENGIPRVVESEAKIVRKIYRLYLEGLTPNHIAKKLTEEGIPTPAKKKVWQSSTVESILTNEKYKGDALLQKKFTVDFLTKKQKTNEGEIPQYYVEGSHEGIVTAEVFDLVQYEIQRRREYAATGRYSSTSIFSSRIFCGDCGGSYGAKTWHSNQKYRKIVYRCNHKYGEVNGTATNCTTPVLTEDEIKSSFLDAFNRCIKNKDEIIDNCNQAIAVIIDTEKMETEAATLEEECSIVAEMIRKCVESQAHALTPSEDYEERYNGLVDRYSAAKTRLESIQEDIAQRNYRKAQISFFLESLRQQEQLVTTFDPIIWNTVIDRVTIYSRKRIVFKFKGGMEVTRGVE